MREVVGVQISWCEERGEPLPFPSYATPQSAGLDVRSAVDCTILPMQRHAVPTGLKLVVPAGFEMQVRARSGLSSKQGLTLINGVGTIDSDFRGEVHVLTVNLGSEPIHIRRGDRVAQFVLMPLPRVLWDEIDEKKLNREHTSDRGEGGFGSTGWR